MSHSNNIQQILNCLRQWTESIEKLPFYITDILQIVEALAAWEKMVRLGQAAPA